MSQTKNEAIRQQKQQFLRTQIIQPRYSAEAFSAFLHTKREVDGCNIDNWTVTELTAITMEFKSLNKPEDELSGDDENIDKTISRNPIRNQKKTPPVNKKLFVLK